MAKDLTVEQIVKVYGAKAGNVSATCEALGIARKTFYEWKAKKKKLADALEEVDESLIDFAENKLMQHIQNDDLQATMFFLRTKGRKRGYVEKTESDVNINAFEKLMQETDE